MAGFRILIAAMMLLPLMVAAQAPPVRVVDARTGAAVAFAHVKATETGAKTAKYYLSDDDGMIRHNLVRPTVFQVSYVGYQTFSDTLFPGDEAMIRLLPEVFSLDEVVVTAQYNPGSADRSLYRVNVINQLQLRRTAATDLSGLLRNQMNVRFTQDASLGTGMSLQGLSGEHVKILVDGVPVIGRLNGSIDLSQVNLQNARQVEIIEGPMSVIYGSNALAGVVNIISGDIPGRSLTANAGTYLESVGIVNFDGGFSLNRGKNAFSLQAGRNFFAGYSPADEGRAKLWKPRRQLNADAGYNLTLKKAVIKTKLSYFDELLLVRGNLLPPYFEKAFDNHFTTSRLTAKADITTRGPNPFTASNSLSFYNRVRTLYYNDLTIPEKTPTEYDTTGFGSFLSRAMYTYRSTSGLIGIQAGYDANVEWATGERTGNQHHRITDIAGFATMQIQPADLISLQPGLRYAWNSHFASPLIYAMHVKAGPAKGFIFRTSYSSGFRAPSLKELYLYFVDVNHNITGNPNLSPERSKHIQFQASHRIEKVTYATETEARFFLNDIDNQITLAETGDGAYTYFNLDRSRSMGYVFSLRSSLYPLFDLRLGWGRTGKSNQLVPGEKLRLYWSPELTSEVTCRMDEIDLHLTAIYKYTGKTTRIYMDENGLLSEGYMDSWHNMDLTVLKTFMQKRLSVNAGVRNLFDVTNIVSAGGSGGVHSGGGGNVPVAWGRTYFLKLSYTFLKDDPAEKK
jgi:outer membrane receptor for ferrienterochelin and colicins